LVTEYSKVVRSFMAQRGLTEVAQLHRLLVASGNEDFSYGRLLNALNKRWVARGRDPRLDLAIAQALELDTSEMARMALAAMAED
jgi:hypothetical protein